MSGVTKGFSKAFLKVFRSCLEYVLEVRKLRTRRWQRSPRDHEGGRVLRWPTWWSKKPAGAVKAEHGFTLIELLVVRVNMRWPGSDMLLLPLERGSLSQSVKSAQCVISRSYAPQTPQTVAQCQA